jgi:acetyl esterase
MNKATLTKPILDPVTQRFLDMINTQGGRPIYELSPAEARRVLLKIQETPTNLLPADLEDHTIPVGPKGEVRIRIARPKGNTAKLPAVMHFHGGGWILGDQNTHDRLIREIANKVQAAVIFVDYDPSPEVQFPVAIEEAYAATCYISENGNSFNLDTSKLAVVGDSVGGNMVAAVTMMAKERGGPRIDYQVLFYPVTAADFNTESYKALANGYWLSRESMKWFWNAYLPNESSRKQPLASPLTASVEQLRGLPPALIITGEYDLLRDEGEAYAHKLMQAGVPTTAIRFLGAIHDFVMLNALAETPATRGAIELASIKLCQALTR